MSDPFLTARLDELEQHLRGAEENCLDWDSVNLQISDTVREGFRRAIMNQIREHSSLLRRIRDLLQSAEETNKINEKKLLLEKAWRRYREVYQQCQRFFSEYMEVIGGLAFRSSVQGTIYELADALIRSCVLDTTQIFSSVSPTVPALPETLLKTLAHIIGLRFPEWTIWTLPITAHELGHVVIHEDGKLKEFIEGLAKEEKWTAENTKRRSRKHLTEFIADAFATYVMGPSYAYSVVLLKFDPTSASHDDDDQPADVKRLHVVFTMLGLMDQEAGGMAKPYESIITQLKEHWGNMSKSAGQEDVFESSDKHQLEALVNDTWEAFYDCLRDSARYPHEGKDYGLEVAQGWSKRWSEQLKEGNPLSIEKVSGLNTYRDVLNAAWFCRMDYPDQGDKIREIEKAAYALCEEIKEEKHRTSAKRSKTGRTPKSPSRRRF